jgi:hypothetical protein
LAEKTLYLNGKAICNYEAPPDSKAEMELCRRLLKERGLWTLVSAETVIFNQAVAFANTAALVYERDLSTQPIKNGHSAGPFVVNSAFATELYLKTLGLLYGKEMHGHDLAKLFREIPQEGLKAVEKKLAELAPKDGWLGNIATKDDFSAVGSNFRLRHYRKLARKSRASSRATWRRPARSCAANISSALAARACTSKARQISFIVLSPTTRRSILLIRFERSTSAALMAAVVCRNVLTFDPNDTIPPSTTAIDPMATT